MQEPAGQLPEERMRGGQVRKYCLMSVPAAAGTPAGFDGRDDVFRIASLSAFGMKFGILTGLSQPFW